MPDWVVNILIFAGGSVFGLILPHTGPIIGELFEFLGDVLGSVFD